MSSVPLALPRFATFGARYLNARDQFNQQEYLIMQFAGRQGPDHGIITFGDLARQDEGIWNPYAKFEVEDASTKEGLVHIKSCYNHKYLRKASEDPQKLEIAAAADEPEEDTSIWSSTLFKLDFKTAESSVNVPGYEFWLHHSGQERQAITHQEASFDVPMKMVLDDGRTSQLPSFKRFDVFDLDRLPILPAVVCLKADNDRYLRIESNTTTTRRASFTGRDRREEETQFEVVYTRLRSVVLRPVTLPSSYLVRGGTVYQTSTNTRDWRNAPLEPVLLNFAGPPAVAFKSLAHLNNAFIERRDVSGVTDAFTVSGRTSSILAQSEFLIEETVRSRQLSNIQFYYDDMNILEPTPIAVLTKRVRNGSRESTQEGHLSFRYSEYESSHWETTHSWQVDASYGIQTVASARLPVLKFIRVETTVSLEVSAGYQGEQNVGETKVEESEMTTSFTLRVPPMTESLVNMVVSRGKVQLPYSYTQREMLQDGSIQSIKKVDGLYEGEATHVDYDVQESRI